MPCYDDIYIHKGKDVMNAKARKRGFFFLDAIDMFSISERSGIPNATPAIFTSNKLCDLKRWMIK